MELFGLIDTLRAYCTNKGWAFFYGKDDIINAQADTTSYINNKIIMLAEFEVIPTYANGRLDIIQYSGYIALGEKFEAYVPKTETNLAIDASVSQLDEYTLQKYDRRLKYLTTLWNSTIETLLCQNSLDVTGVRLRFDLNKFDFNADFVAGSLTIIQ